MKKTDFFLSYLYPVTIESTGSKWNPVLDVVLSAGKLSLNSRNSNYSYGSLYLLFEKVFRKVSIRWERINRVLILGFGAGGAAEIINRYSRDCRIDGVEIDEKVIELGRKYFSLDHLDNVSVHVTGAFEYVKKCNSDYDLIIIDVYQDMDVPPEIESEEFLAGIRKILSPGGLAISNKFIHDRQSMDQVGKLSALYIKVFGNLEVMNLMLTGKVFVSAAES